MTYVSRDLANTASQLYRRNFFSFVWKVFQELHGDQAEFIPNWHIQAMCHELEKVRHGRNRRLVITVPPRHLKSITTAVAFTCFILGHSPSRKIIVASYGLDLGRKHTADCRRILESRWYQALFQATRLAARGNTSDELKTTAGGGRKAVSTGGAVTGHGCDYLIIDDLLKAGDAWSEAELRNAQDFIDGSLLSRFDRPVDGRVVCIQQRLHEVDPAGYLLEKGVYKHLNLPAIAEVEVRFSIGRGQTRLRRVDEPLFPQLLPREELDRKRKEMGSASFNCQYQQNPIAPDGSALRWEWFGTYEDAPSRRAFQLIVQSWDTGMSADPRSDFSVCTTWGYMDRKWRLLGVFRDRLDYPHLKQKALSLADRWEADRVLIEDAASGKPLIQECHDTNPRIFQAIKPAADKEVRFNAACAPVEAGDVLLPKEAPWLPEFRRELQSFPRGRHDDQVDSFSQFLNWSKGAGFYRLLERGHPVRIERLERAERRRAEQRIRRRSR